MARPRFRSDRPRRNRESCKIGCTALIWGALPRSPENLTPAVKTWPRSASTDSRPSRRSSHDWDAKGTLAPLIEQHRIPLDLRLRDRAADRHRRTRKENLAQLIQWGKALKKHGGRFMVLAPNGVKREAYNFAEHRANIVAGLNDYAKAMNDVGLGAGLHQHTEHRGRVARRNLRGDGSGRHAVLKFAPDVGQLQKGGADAAKVVKDFLPRSRSTCT